MSISRKRPNLKISPYSGAPCFMALSLALPSTSPAVEFNPDFLQGRDAPVELKYFEQGSTVRPGSYDVDVYLNQSIFRRQSINFSANPGNADVRPVIRAGLLKELGVDVARLMRENLIPADTDDSTPLDIAALVPGASVEFEVNELALLISMPHAYVQRHSRGYVDPSLWDDGITALFTNYQANFSRNSNPGQTSDYRYVGLRNGLNLLGWRLRNEASLRGGTGMRNKLRSDRNFLERDIRQLKGTLSLGELYTHGDIFDSVRMRGIQLKSDIGMLPDNEIGYAPVVHGIAETNATVEVSQNGYVVYSTSVSPGAFEITDIYPNGSNGDLQIKIIEADGRERTYSQSYSYLPVMTRKGSLRYSVAAGEYHTEGQSSPSFTQGTAVYGATDNLTGYGGLLATQKYNAVNLGIGINSGYGGLSFDVTNSQSKPQRGGRKQGQSARFLYSKTVSATDTTFTMVGYRYSTDGYRTLSQHVEDMDYVSGERVGRQKSRFDLTINQSLQARGSLFVSAGETNYWNRQGNTRRWQLGYSDSVRTASYSLAVSRTQEAGSMGQSDTQFTASVSFPLGQGNSHRASSNAVSSRHGDSSLQSGVSGFLDDKNTVNYSAQAGYSKDNKGSGSFGLGWDTARASLSANYSLTRDSKHTDLGASGSVVLHSGGVTFGQSVGETFALVEVPDTSGIGLDSHGAIRTDSRGYAVVPYVQPYRYNWLNLDTTTLDTSTDITENAQRVVPTRGAVVKGRFAAVTGRRLQFELSLDTGKKVPFGAQAFDEEGKSLGIVDHRSRLLVFGSQDKGRLDVRWEGNSCSVNYDLPPVNKALTYERFATLCQSR
ncbi:fimbria/pilus outer membrane usher protein [Pseudomonas sp. JS3066]|uniref:fimbria/pilus outer membrane usher protein n=1 Tax=Pseudomonas sp. JS3066 TaxID=3090665 RepID=UPI002E7C20E5|nr:fimbria/pilus outer membrane usher protein [Pseudomonas sp. JS3066]WVK92967.1 fimbria/pilus outer membrane usher protein [Pseudomonas sp. JS3066]